MKISAAGNTEIPALLTLEERGVEVRCEQGSMQWIAKYSNVTYTAETPLELLGLVEMHSVRGVSWKATDLEIDRCIKQYPGLV